MIKRDVEFQTIFTSLRLSKKNAPQSEYKKNMLISKKYWLYNKCWGVQQIELKKIIKR